MRLSRLVVLALVMLLAWPLATAAQPAAPDVAPDTPFRVEWTYPATDLPHVQFRVLVDGESVITFTPPQLTTTGASEPTATIRGTVPGIAAGTRVLRLEAFNSHGVAGMEIPVVAGVVPVAPGGLRIVKIVTTVSLGPDGSIVAMATTTTTTHEKR